MEWVYITEAKNCRQEIVLAFMELTIYLRKINKNCVQDSKSFVKLNTQENTHSLLNNH